MILTLSAIHFLLSAITEKTKKAMALSGFFRKKGKLMKLKEVLAKVAGVFPINIFFWIVKFIQKTMVWILIKLVKFYQYFISPLSPPSCRYYPTCSNYTIEALRIHGVLKGGYLSIKRILKCNPYFLGGVDEVPPKKIKTAKTTKNTDNKNTQEIQNTNEEIQASNDNTENSNKKQKTHNHECCHHTSHKNSN